MGARSKTMDSNTKRGIISNTLALVFLFGVSYPLDIVFFACVALGVQWFTFIVHGLPCSSEKFYDLSGSATHLSLVLSSLVMSKSLHSRGIILSVCCVMWFTRLGSYLFARILRDGRDDRFDELKKSHIRFLGAWTIQAFWVFALNLPILILNNKDQSECPLGPLDAIGMSLWLAGFLIEGISDTQKNVFRSKDANRAKFITTGLWAYSRHPNYLGEHMIWTGVCLSASSSFHGAEFLGWLAVAITVLLLWKVSGIPGLEAKADEKWGNEPEYQHYKKHTNVFLFGSAAPALEAAKKK